MTKLREQYLCSALDKFKTMVTNGECSKADISYFCNLAKYELSRRGTSIDKKEWLTKKEVSEKLNMSTSSFDRLVLNGLMPRGKKVSGSRKLLWKGEQVEQLRHFMLLKGNT